MQTGIHVKATEARTITTKFGMGACQIFTVVPQQLKIVSYNETELATASRAGLHIWIHSSYLVSPWGDKPYNIPFCIKQLHQARTIGAEGVIFHIPKAPASKLVAGLKRLLAQKPAARIILENKAVRPDQFATYETPEKINALIDTFIAGGIARKDIWLCFDTAHLYCSGVNLRDREIAEQWFAKLKYPDRIACFHLNGNASTTFSDKHAIAFGPKDRIWGTPKISFDKSGAKVIRDFCKKHGVDIILECSFENEKSDALALLRILDSKNNKK